MASAVANPQYMGYKALYRTVLEDSKRGIAKALRIFADPDAFPVLIHCIHGALVFPFMHASMHMRLPHLWSPVCKAWLHACPLRAAVPALMCACMHACVQASLISAQPGCAHAPGPPLDGEVLSLLVCVAVLSR
jgi:hypothetical protein